MTIIRHGLTAADRAAMTAFRARLAAHPIAITRASYDATLEGKEAGACSMRCLSSGRPA